MPARHDRDRRVEDGLRVTGHPLVPLIWELDRICEGDAGGYAHWGATTQNITQTGQILGTPDYIAPEQVPNEQVDHRADLFSVGVMLPVPPPREEKPPTMTPA